MQLNGGGNLEDANAGDSQGVFHFLLSYNLFSSISIQKLKYAEDTGSEEHTNVIIKTLKIERTKILCYLCIVIEGVAQKDSPTSRVSRDRLAIVACTLHPIQKSALICEMPNAPSSRHHIQQKMVVKSQWWSCLDRVGVWKECSTVV